MLRSSLLALLALLSLVASACAPAHMQLARAPTKDAPLEERRAFYEDHRPVLVQAAKGTGSFAQPAFVELQDGTRVYHPADLLSHVEEGSPTAQAVRRFEEAEQARLAWRAVSWVFSAVALAGQGAVIGYLLVGAPGEVAPLQLGLSAGMLVVLTPLLFQAASLEVRASKERETAFLTYDRSLRERLSLAPGPPASSAPDDPPPVPLPLSMAPPSAPPVTP